MSSEKKHKSGFALLKEKLAKAEAKINELEKQLNVEVAEHQALEDKYEKLRKELIRTTQDGHKQYNEQQESIHKQAAKISQQAKELNDAVGEIYNTAHQRDEAIRRMGALRRWWYGYKYPHSASDGNVELK